MHNAVGHFWDKMSPNHLLGGFQLRRFKLKPKQHILLKPNQPTSTSFCLPGLTVSHLTVWLLKNEKVAFQNDNKAQNLICINLGCGNYSWYTLPEIEHGRLCIVWNYIYSCISFDLNPVFFWKNTEIMLTKQIGVPEAWLIWMTDFLPCFYTQLLCLLNVRRHFVRNVCFVRMDILSGWTFCQLWTFCQEETFCKEDLLSGLHFQGKTQTQTPDNYS